MEPKVDSNRWLRRATNGGKGNIACRATSKGHVAFPSQALSICMKMFFQQMTGSVLRKSLFLICAKTPSGPAAVLTLATNRQGASACDSGEKHTTFWDKVGLQEEGKCKLICFAPFVISDVTVWQIYSLRIKFSLQVRDITK